MTVRSIARRLLVVTAALAALVSVQAVQTTSSADAAGYTNTVVSRTGASLSSYGFCGGSTFNFTVSTAGFEYIRIITVTSTRTSYGAWTGQGRPASYRYQLPYAYQHTSYVVEGLDWNAGLGQYESYLATTSFTQVPDLTYSTWFC